MNMEKKEKLRKVINFKSEDAINVLKIRNIFYHPTWLIKKEVYIKLNGYRNIQYVEDYDFLCRAVLNGYKLGVCDEVLLKYRIRSNSISNFLIQSSNFIEQL